MSECCVVLVVTGEKVAEAVGGGEGTKAGSRAKSLICAVSLKDCCCHQWTILCCRWQCHRRLVANVLSRGWMSGVVEWALVLMVVSCWKEKESNLCILFSIRARQAAEWMSLQIEESWARHYNARRKCVYSCSLTFYDVHWLGIKNCVIFRLGMFGENDN